MPLTDIIRRASTLILGTDDNNLDYNNSDKKTNYYQDNEILFCKNNVCVHPPAMIRQDTDILHNPGYLTITTKIFIDQYNDSKRPTLFLTWIPNTTLTKCSNNLSLIKNNSINNDNEDNIKRKRDDETSTTSTDDYDNGAGSLSSSVSSMNSLNNSTNPFLFNDTEELITNTSDDNNLLLININVDISNPEIEIITTPTSEQNKQFSPTSSNDSNNDWFLTTTPEFLAQKHNLTFPNNSSNNSSPILSNNINKCRRFSVDLSQMRSLRLFFNDNNCTCGQLVIASRESQYKILHFHYGGLDHLAQVLHQWHSLLHNIKHIKDDNEDLPYRHFMVCRPDISNLELHPEEGQVSKLTETIYRKLFNNFGQLDDDLTLRKLIFFSGIERNLRKQVWPFLLHVYPYQSTFLERQQIFENRKQEYNEITRRRLQLNDIQLTQFQKKIENVIEKDVIRTDRANPFFSGDNNPNLILMKNILLNYAVYNPSLGYTQGMSDLLAPVLCELKDEVMTFWCFVGLMQRAVFVATPTDRDMDRSLKYLRELIRIMLPHFHQHLEKHKNATELLFCHRWILLCFKREFTEAVALRMWESCWANYLTDYFHLFLCLAIISVYADDVIAQNLRADEMLLHFSSLAMYMDGLVIARKARGLLHQFRQLREIPCTLSGLCTRCGPGIWDSSHSPRIYCLGHEITGHCNNSIN